MIQSRIISDLMSNEVKGVDQIAQGESRVQESREYKKKEGQKLSLQGYQYSLGKTPDTSEGD